MREKFSDCLKCGQPIIGGKGFAVYCSKCRGILRRYGIVTKNFVERKRGKLDSEFKKEFEIKPHKTYLEILEERTYSDPNYRGYRKFIKGRKVRLDFYSV